MICATVGGMTDMKNMNNRNNNTQFICTVAIGVALYVALSMVAKVPLIGHIGLDLGYIVLAIYCYRFGAASGAIIGAFGCMFVSLIASGWLPIGWIIGNATIGMICGNCFKKKPEFLWAANNVAYAIISVLIGVFLIKTLVECALYGIPLMVKIPKNMVAAVADAIVMSIGVFIAPMFDRK